MTDHCKLNLLLIRFRSMKRRFDTSVSEFTCKRTNDSLSLFNILYSVFLLTKNILQEEDGVFVCCCVQTEDMPILCNQ